MHNTDLPDKLSALIRLALADLEAVEQDDRYQVDMNYWHGYNSERPHACQVCMAGAVMAMSLDADISKNVSPAIFAPDMGTIYKLRAIDCARAGTPRNLRRALKLLGVNRVTSLVGSLFMAELFFPPYEDDPAEFKRGCLRLATGLERLGL